MRRLGILRAIAGSLILGLAAAGCASTGDVDTVRGDVDTVRDDAQEARRLAEEANAKATLAAADAVRRADGRRGRREGRAGGQPEIRPDLSTVAPQVAGSPPEPIPTAAPRARVRVRRGKADWVLVLKAPRRLLLLRGDRVLRDYEIALGRSPTGPKRRQGDGRTPEGRYRIDSRVADSRFHRALHISYPNQGDLDFARRAGIAPGGDVMLHGLPDGERWVGDVHREFDWTNGCIAVTDDEMSEIWELVDDGTPIEIRP